MIRCAADIAAPRAGVLLAETGEGPLELSWQKLILAVGARELFLPFPGWTLPNVTGPGGMQVLVKAGLPVAGKRVVVAGSGPLLIAASAELRKAGARVVVVAEQAGLSDLVRFAAALPRSAPKKIFQALQYQLRLLGVPYRTGCWVTAAQGGQKVEQVTIQSQKKTWTIPCDYLACAYGLVPNLELPRLLGCRLENGVVLVNLWQETLVGDVYCAGEPTGIGGEDRALIEGRIAGHAASGRTDKADCLFKARKRARKFSLAMDRAFALRDELKHLAQPDTIVCRCEDVTRRQLEPYDGWRSAKLHTRCGMGPCQGRVCGGAARVLFGWKHESVRPPLFPVTVGTLADADLLPENKSS
jgi:NADPH-dependent 2,4-dienoyl-CoA reductase/sulfur reductase-like enzyme